MLMGQKKPKRTAEEMEFLEAWNEYPHCCIVCGINFPIQCHRPIPGAQGGKYEAGNTVALCTTCHAKYHSFLGSNPSFSPMKATVRLNRSLSWIAYIWYTQSSRGFGLRGYQRFIRALGSMPEQFIMEAVNSEEVSDGA